MNHPRKTAALAATLALLAGGAPNAASAAPIAYVYNLAPGELDFTIDSTALNAQGFGTVDSTLGLTSLSLRLGGQTFLANSDAFFPTQPYITLVSSNVSFAVFSPARANVSYDFFASQGTVATRFDYTFTGSDNSSITGTGSLVSRTAVPEPATVTLLATGLIGLAARRKRG